jgi:hypothetical protein
MLESQLTPAAPLDDEQERLVGVLLLDEWSSDGIAAPP